MRPGPTERFIESRRDATRVGGIREAMIVSVLLAAGTVVLPGTTGEAFAQGGGATGAALVSAPARESIRPVFRADAWGLPDEGLLGFVEIPAGPFLMGSDPDLDPQSFENERWAEGGGPGSVDLPTYFIGRYEVTVGQFHAFVEATGHRADPQALSAPEDHPVSFVSWPDALAYSRWLEAELKASAATPTRLREALDAGWRVTLPTEAEWEKAARGTDGRIFPWGNEPLAGFANIGGRTTAPVGSFACELCANGLADASGNVWEWTRTPHSVTRYGEADQGPDLEADALWVMRGGSFNDPANLNRAAVRGGADPGARRGFIGFRVVITPS